eukprot:CAMPEP_0198134330 /NCGR_PEP_ID=MMETSP1442-20131203/60014_1 /TAXON_ID= /ORGANISM="Craspedostauros australis, Strain CCMP3328" /LENGTH=743 /DNA_ID=CAMNT_0043795473 /DNA_START=72 /DNA_END=2303 /DNA_ORIENTATION=+
MRVTNSIAALLCVLVHAELAQSGTANTEQKANFIVGSGIYDMTGPAAQVGFMGYAKTSQIGHGIHTRLRARAYIISQLEDGDEEQDANVDVGLDLIHQKQQQQQEQKAELANERTSNVEDAAYKRAPNHNLKYERVRVGGHHRGQLSHVNANAKPKEPDGSHSAEPRTLPESVSPDNTICFVSVDIGMGSDLLNIRVLKRLEELLPAMDDTGRRLCHVDNLSISGTHTHSAPGGFLQYVLYQITTAGFSEEAMGAFVEGVAQSIVRAIGDMDQGSISVNQGKLFGANINRSPTSYPLNPQSERDEYSTDGDTDKTMVQLMIEHTWSNTSGQSQEPIGLINWFAVHGTSLNATNLLISGDNKGYASYLMEKKMNPGILPGQGSFVAAFASTNLGDVSPNTAGPRCIDTGKPCDLVTSTCGGNTNLCIASGPGKNMLESAEIIGRKQFEKAIELMEAESEQLEGTVSYRHSFVDMSNLTVTLSDGTEVQTCPAALGYAFAGGTTDGPGQFPFHQSTNTSNPFWNMISGFLSIPTQKQVDCQAPKPILLNTGEVKLPYSWDPKSVPVSIFRIGSFFILNVPAELTTMAGRRLRKAVRSILENRGIDDPYITIAGLANSYTHYVTTFEEYAGQRYEAASTLYGPHTLAGYIQEFERITSDLMDDRESSSDPPPKDLGDKQVSLIPPRAVDTVGFARTFGSVAVQPKDSYVRGRDTASASFRSANPRHNPPRAVDTVGFARTVCGHNR